MTGYLGTVLAAMVLEHLFLSMPRALGKNFEEVSVEIEAENVIVLTESEACTTSSNDIGTCVSQQQQEASSCSLWFAPSTIPGGGMGMFAGKNFSRKEKLMLEGDIVIPIVDLEYHQWGHAEYFLWDEYTWNGEALKISHEGQAQVEGASPGFGAAANSVLDLVNVDESAPSTKAGSVGLDRWKDPGVGAFSYYHNRQTKARTDIAAGEELFVSYGENWFETREQHLGALPLKGHHRIADKLLAKYKSLERTYNATLPRVLEALWHMFLLEKPTKESHILNALPNNHDDLVLAKELGLKEFKRQQATVSMEYLKANGTCASILRVYNSTISQAGRGAFAGRSFAMGEVVAPAPLIHLVDGQLQMEMYNLIEFEGDYSPENRSELVGKQLLINYCFGHGNSTLLLCPYGVQTAFINHGFKSANVKIQWADPHKSIHDPSWLNRSLAELNKLGNAVLAFEFVATRPIQEGEEILLNYGSEWEAAWNQHVATWKSHAVGAFQKSRKLNADKESPLATMAEQETDPYPFNAELKCYAKFLEQSERQPWKTQLTSEAGFKKHVGKTAGAELLPCNITSRTEDDTGRYFYTAERREANGTLTEIEGLPREAFAFVDKIMSSDMHLKNAFRHDVRIPDDMFPEHWKNLIKNRPEHAGY